MSEDLPEDAGTPTSSDVQALTKTGAELLPTVLALIKVQNERIKRKNVLINVMIGALVADVIFTVIVFANWRRTDHTQDQIQAVVAEQARQNARFDDMLHRGLCPLAAINLGAYDPDSRAPGEPRKRYQKAIDTLYPAYGDLDCEQLVQFVPPRKDMPQPSTTLPMPPN